MLKEILIAGFGGQGIMLMGQLLAYGGIYEDLEVSFFPSYGPEMRGGTANCTVIISDRRIGSPIRNSFGILLAMSQAALEKYENSVNPGGIVAFNETLIDTGPVRKDISVVEIPANRIATAIGNPQVANMVAVGGLIPILEVISPEALSKGLARVLPENRHHLIPLNEKAIQEGIRTYSK